MPKKKNKVSKKDKKKIKEIQSKKKIIKKESTLEKEIEETEEALGETEFREFLGPTIISAPTLKKILIQEPLETNITSSSTSNTSETRPADYMASSNEPKYTNTSNGVSNEDDQKKYESNFGAPVLGTTNSRNQDSGLITPARDVRIETNDNTARIEMNVLEQKRRDPFEVQEKKYKEVRL